MLHNELILAFMYCTKPPDMHMAWPHNLLNLKWDSCITSLIMMYKAFLAVCVIAAATAVPTGLLEVSSQVEPAPAEPAKKLQTPFMPFVNMAAIPAMPKPAVAGKPTKPFMDPFMMGMMGFYPFFPMYGSYPFMGFNWFW